MKVNWGHVTGLLIFSLAWGVVLSIFHVPSVPATYLVSFILGMAYGIMFPLVTFGD